MEKLMKPAEYAKELGISRQAVYAKIKKGILTAKEVEGKLYIVVDTVTAQATPGAASVSQKPSTASTNTKTALSPSGNKALHEEYQKLLAAKDETIEVLKGTVEDLKESNRQISSTLKGEIDLLKSAFSEMRALYVHRIEQMKVEQSEVTEDEEILEADIKPQEQSREEQEWIGAKKFLKQQNIIKEKQKNKILNRLKKAFKNGDERISKIDGKLKLDTTKLYEDILQ